MYRKRKGGATIEAINMLRTRLGKVVFIWVPSHLGVPCNAYADAVASAAIDAPAQTPVTALVAAEVRLRLRAGPASFLKISAFGSLTSFKCEVKSGEKCNHTK